MTISQRVAAIATREVKRFVGVAAARAARTESSRSSRPSFRALSEAETEALLGDELPEALSGALRRA